MPATIAIRAPATPRRLFLGAQVLLEKAAGPRIGAASYNLIHNWAIGFGVLSIGLWLDSPAVLVLAAVLIAHVGVDRALGYGLKYPTAFHDTHLGRIGRMKA